MLGGASDVVELCSSLWLLRSSHELDFLNGWAVNLISSLNPETCDFVSESEVSSEAVTFDRNEHSAEMRSVAFDNSDDITRHQTILGVSVYKTSTPSFRVNLL